MSHHDGHTHDHDDDPMMLWRDSMDDTYESTVRRDGDDSMVGTLRVVTRSGDLLHSEKVWLGDLNEERAEWVFGRWTYRVEEVVDHPALRLP